MDNKQAAAAVLQQISQVLDDIVTTDTYPGLLGGYTGCALFYAYYYQLTERDEHLEKVHALILKSIEALSAEAMSVAHCNGITGIAWSIQHLIELGFIEEDDIADTFSEIDLIAGRFLTAELAEERLDFLHQGLGIALYLLERLPAEHAATHLTALVQQLEQQAIPLEHGISWRDNFSATSREEKEQPVFNLGLAHGMPAIIALLGRIYEKGIVPERTLPLIEKSVQWLLATRNKEVPAGGALFPVIVDRNNVAINGTQSRLGWCYGDLGIAAVLWQTGVRTGREDYKTEAHLIFKHIVQHRNAENGSINDACLCHGSAGVAHMLLQAFKATGDPLLQQGAEFWLQATLKMNTWEDGLAGYKFLHHPDYVNSHNVLEGIAGIGLALMSFVDDNTVPAWDECLLMS
ncbi:lanthionine synthetase C family protein [Chitinophaga nivalis]|uniref:Lanthionine synthetase C family protein n=1 Tax=Chitinophaga nivalis TaxID=2991709 RepID=A0ABT3IHY8_9BACT|nr:lanthionine synthetase C family protein [Chitinophaga nivalis]MCW3466724.1 lanthionine synthetase C family protein [Chitinophaga nivalis]MCW3483585.1 lanthionine synthetase C family protein [Chitinophaga nivalis]